MANYYFRPGATIENWDVVLPTLMGAEWIGDGAVITVDTGGAHGLSAGDIVYVDGGGGDITSGDYTVTGTPTSSEFTFSFSSSSDGNLDWAPYTWYDAATNGGKHSTKPGSSDAVYIVRNTCLLTMNEAAASVSISSGKKLNLNTYNLAVTGAVTVSGTLTISTSAGTGLTCEGLTFASGSSRDWAEGAKINNSGDLSFAGSSTSSTTPMGYYTQTANGAADMGPDKQFALKSLTVNVSVQLDVSNSPSYLGGGDITLNGTLYGKHETFTLWSTTGTFTIGANGNFTSEDDTVTYFEFVDGVTFVNNRTTPLGFWGHLYVEFPSGSDSFVFPCWNFISSPGISASLTVHAVDDDNQVIFYTGSLSTEKTLGVAHLTMSVDGGNSLKVANDLYNPNFVFEGGFELYNDLRWSKGTGTITTKGGSIICEAFSLEDLIVTCYDDGDTALIDCNATFESLTVTVGEFNMQGWSIMSLGATTVGPTYTSALSLGASFGTGLTTTGLSVTGRGSLGLPDSAVINNYGDAVLTDTTPITTRGTGIYRQVGSGNYMSADDWEWWQFEISYGVTLTTNKNGKCGISNTNTVSVQILGNLVIGDGDTVVFGMGTGDMVLGETADIRGRTTLYMPCLVGAGFQDARLTPLSFNGVVEFGSHLTTLQDATTCVFNFSNADVVIWGGASGSALTAGTRRIATESNFGMSYLYCHHLRFDNRNAGDSWTLDDAAVNPDLHINGDLNATPSTGTVAWSKGTGRVYREYINLATYTVPNASMGLESLTQFSNGTVMSLGYNNGQLYNSTDFGLTWGAGHASPDSHPQGACQLANGWVLLVGNNSKCYKSTDLGQTWDAGVAIDVGKAFTCIKQLTNGDVLAVAQDSQKIYASTDNGATWTVRNSGSVPIWMNTIIQTGTGRVITCGQTPSDPYYSDDNGSTWTKVTKNWYDVTTLCCLSNGTIVGVDFINAVMYASVDNGLTWDAGASIPVRDNTIILYQLLNGTVLVSGFNKSRVARAAVSGAKTLVFEETRSLNFNGLTVEDITHNDVNGSKLTANVTTDSLTISAGTLDLQTYNLTSTGATSVAASSALKMGVSAGTGLTTAGLTFSGVSCANLQTTSIINNSGNLVCPVSGFLVNDLTGTYTQTSNATATQPQNAKQTVAGDGSGGCFYSWRVNNGVTLTASAALYMGPAANGIGVGHSVYLGSVTSPSAATVDFDGYAGWIAIGTGGTLSLATGSDIKGNATLGWIIAPDATVSWNAVAPLSYSGSITQQGNSGAERKVLAVDLSNASVTVKAGSSGTATMTPTAGTLKCINFYVANFASGVGVIMNNNTNNPSFVCSGEFNLNSIQGFMAFPIVWNKGSGTIQLTGTGTKAVNLAGQSVEAITVNTTNASDIRQMIPYTFPNASFTVTGTTAVVSYTAHGMTTGDIVVISSSTNTGALPNGSYALTTYTTDTFTITGLTNGSGTCSWTKDRVSTTVSLTLTKGVFDMVTRSLTSTGATNVANGASLKMGVTTTQNPGLTTAGLTFGGAAGSVDLQTLSKINNSGNLTVSTSGAWLNGFRGSMTQTGTVNYYYNNISNCSWYNFTQASGAITITGANAYLTDQTSNVTSISGTINLGSYSLLLGAAATGSITFGAGSDMLGNGSLEFKIVSGGTFSKQAAAWTMTGTVGFVREVNTSKAGVGNFSNSTYRIRTVAGATLPGTIATDAGTITCASFTTSTGTTTTTTVDLVTNNTAVTVSGAMTIPNYFLLSFGSGAISLGSLAITGSGMQSGLAGTRRTVSVSGAATCSGGTTFKDISLGARNKMNAKSGAGTNLGNNLGIVFKDLVKIN